MACAQAQTYTLTNDDVVVEESMIKSCSYSFELKDIIIPETRDGQTVTGISNWSLVNKGMTSVEFPSTLQTIKGYSMANNELASLDFSGCADLATIGWQAFVRNRIRSVDFSGLHITHIN